MHTNAPPAEQQHLCLGRAFGLMDVDTSSCWSFWQELVKSITHIAHLPPGSNNLQVSQGSMWFILPFFCYGQTKLSEYNNIWKMASRRVLTQHHLEENRWKKRVKPSVEPSYLASRRAVTSVYFEHITIRTKWWLFLDCLGQKTFFYDNKAAKNLGFWPFSVLFSVLSFKRNSKWEFSKQPVTGVIYLFGKMIYLLSLILFKILLKWKTMECKYPGCQLNFYSYFRHSLENRRDEDEADIKYKNIQICFSLSFLLLFGSKLDLEMDRWLHSASALTQTLVSCSHLWSYIIHTNLIYSQLK